MRRSAAVYGSDQELRTHILGFLMEGLTRDEKVVAVVPPRTGQVLGASLGSGAMMVQWGLPGLNYHHLGRAAETIRGYLTERRESGEMTRLLTESDVDGGRRGPVGWRPTCVQSRPPTNSTAATGSRGSACTTGAGTRRVSWPTPNGSIRTCSAVTASSSRTRVMSTPPPS